MSSKNVIKIMPQNFSKSKFMATPSDHCKQGYGLARNGHVNAVYISTYYNNNDNKPELTLSSDEVCCF